MARKNVEAAIAAMREDIPALVFLRLTRLRAGGIDMGIRQKYSDG